MRTATLIPLLSFLSLSPARPAETIPVAESTADVSLIVWAALLLYYIVDRAGALRVISGALTSLTADRLTQALLLGWVFASLLQGMGGFGVPVAIVAPLLVSMGVPQVRAVIIPAIGHGWAVTFGSLGASFVMLVNVSGLPGERLAPAAAIMLGLFSLLMPQFLFPAGMLGYAPEELASFALSEIWPNKVERERFARSIGGQNAVTDISADLIRRDGELLPVTIAAASLPDTDITCIVSARHPGAWEFPGGEEYLEVFDSLIDAVIILDRDGDILFANTAVATLTGVLPPLATLITPNLPEARALIDAGKAKPLAVSSDTTSAWAALPTPTPSPSVPMPRIRPWTRRNASVAEPVSPPAPMVPPCYSSAPRSLISTSFPKAKSKPFVAREP